MSASPKISSFTIIVTFLCVALAGIAFIPLLPIKLSPSRTLPQLTISYNMPGNSARVIEMEVTSRLEAMLARIKGIKEINSTSGNGWGYVTLELDKHTNIDAARFEASTIIRQTWPSLPDGLSYPVLEMSRPDDKEVRPFMSYTLNAAATPIFIQRFAEDQIKPRLSGIPGIYRIDVSGATPMEWRLEYDSRQLATLGISIPDIQKAISQYYQKEFLGTGNVETQLATSCKEGQSSQWIRLALVPENETDGFNPSLITVLNKDGKLIRLDQLLKVTRQEEAPQSYYRINGLNSIYLSIRAEETANQLELAKRVRAEMEHIRTLLPPGYEIHTSYDATEFIQDELNKIYVRTGLTVLILLMFVLLITREIKYLLLIIISLSINLSIAVILYYLSGLEMQLYSLAGVTISLSLVIDNTIVMTEHIRNRHNRKAILSILAATLTTIGALVIIFFLDEKIRLNLQDFAAVVIINLGVSLLIALFLVPALIDKMNLEWSVPVDAVAQGGGEGVLFPGPPFVLLVQVSLNLVDERPPVFRTVVGVHRKARALVHQKDVLILIDDVQFGGGNGQIGVVFSGGVEEFVVDVELQLVAHFQPGIPLGPLAVALDALQSDVFLGQRGRQQGNGLCQKPIQPLTGIILADGQFFHSFPSSSAKCLLIWSVNSWAAL